MLHKFLVAGPQIPLGYGVMQGAAHIKSFLSLATHQSAFTPFAPQVVLLPELCRACAVQTDFVLSLLEEGVAQPTERQQPQSWRFSELQVKRVSVAWHLQLLERCGPN